MLEITTLGSLAIRCDGSPVTELTTRKVEALLVYLACNRRVHSREVLAEMFWAERTQERSLGNLRVALTSLRKHLSDYVTITRETVTLNPEAHIWLDVAELEENLNAGRVGKAVDLYQGDFLEGFYVRGCPAFEDWASTERERARRVVLHGLIQLVARHTQQGRYEEGINNATRLLQIDPYMEEGQRQLMRLLSHSGQRGTALARYECYRQVLADELGAGPEEETTTLYELIRHGELEAPTAPPVTIQQPEAIKSPAFLEDDVEEEPAPPPVFVARERELDRLQGFLTAALAGQGCVVFVTGGPGRGKTALLGEFARQAMDAWPDLLVASGNCNAYSGVGDPYLPFREVMAMITGEVEARWSAGAITRDHAQRLWSSVPDT
ncbi:BTAD domain-containing putative transcriptional regulator, partial [Chloroflexota bacterium]